MYCQNCGKPVTQGARYCRYCGAELKEVLPPAKRKNSYDENVKSYFTSKTFRTLLIIGLLGGCCYASISFSLLNSVFSFASSLFPSQAQEKNETQPYIVSSTGKELDPQIEAVLNDWLNTSAPADVPYWFVTYWQQESDGRYLVSLAGVNLSSPDEHWSFTEDNKVVWSGSVEINGNAVSLYP